jgi:hypothetical protein
MALIRTFKRIHKDSNRVHEPVECGWTLFEINETKFVQLDTYGSSERQDVGTVSQSIQLDEAAAADLLRIVRQAFPALR